MHLVETSEKHLVGQQPAVQLALVAVLFVLVAEQLMAAADEWWYQERLEIDSPDAVVVAACTVGVFDAVAGVAEAVAA